MQVLKELINLWENVDYPFLINGNERLRFRDLAKQQPVDLSIVQEGDVVALIGDFDSLTILTLLRLIEMKVILVPLTTSTREQHEYFFETALVSVVIEQKEIRRLPKSSSHEYIEKLRANGSSGLVLFSTGTTGRPKAILHDLSFFMQRYRTPRPTLKTINFLLFDHIGGINTLLHTLFNRGTVVAPKSRNVKDILATCLEHDIEVLPTTPTFLRLMLMSGLIPEFFPPNLRLVTYGTERMDQPTLDELCKLLPNVDFRQTYGMSELGIVRVKSKARDSLFMKIGGEGVETRVREDVLEIKSKTRMIGYLNSESPFDDEGWYRTNDIVKERGGYYKIIGRTTEVINVGGLKFMASEVERVALEYDHITFAKVEAKANPITGQHCEITVQPSPSSEINKVDFKKFLSKRLPVHMIPKRIIISKINVGHRFKRL